MTDQRSALLGEESHEELLADSTSTCRSSLTKVAIRGKEVLPDKELQDLPQYHPKKLQQMLEYFA